MARSRKNRIGSNPGRAQHGAKGAGEGEPGEGLDETDIADELKGRNSLSGEDQAQTPSQRHAVPGVRDEPWDILESFKKTDKGYRAKSEELDRDALKPRK
jgi:hypothetical protein